MVLHHSRASSVEIVPDSGRVASHAGGLLVQGLCDKLTLRESRSLVTKPSRDAIIFSPDVYVLAAQRTREAVKAFLDALLDETMLESASEYEWPQHAQLPVIIPSSLGDVLTAVVDAPEEAYAIYWHNTGIGPIRSAMLHFTDDGGMVAGATVERPDDIANALRKLADAVGGRYGFATYDEPPPATSSEFIAAARRAPPPLLLDGQIRN